MILTIHLLMTHRIDPHIRAGHPEQFKPALPRS
jgi:hypothetical protein